MKLFKDSHGDWSLTKIGVGAGVGIVGFILLNSILMIQPGDRGVITRLGVVQPGVLEEGLHFKIPFADSVTRINVRLNKDTVKGNGSSKDLQDVEIEVAVNWKVTSDKVPFVFQEFKTEDRVYERVLEPTVFEAVKAATARKNAENIIVNRPELKADITQAITEKLASYGVTVTDVSIVDINFTPEFDKAIEEKQIAEQNAARAEFEKAERIAIAEGKAEAARLEAEALQAAGGALVLQKEAIDKWNGQLPNTLILGDGKGTLPEMILNSAK